MQHLISVIIPVYNAGEYLSKCLNSIITQTYKNLEIICINDGSTDNSQEILFKYAQNDNRIKIINNPENIGAALTRNVGIDIAQGEYIYFIDSDDYIDEKYLECMADKIEKNNCDIVLNLSIISEANNNITAYKHPSMPEIDPNGQYIDNITAIHDAPCFIWARIFRKDFLKKNNLKFIDTYSDDVAFNTIVNLYTDKTFVFYGEKYHYIINNTGLTGQIDKSGIKDMKHIKAHELIYDFLKEKKIIDRRLKLFRVYPFFKVDSEEKFDLYKMFFEKIKSDYLENENIYNDIEKYFAHSILKTFSYEDYLKYYNKVVTIGYIRSKAQCV